MSNITQINGIRITAESASFASTVPASGVIGLNLTQIATASFTASVTPTQFTVTSASITELTVAGTGVTIGNALTDAHRVTGSLSITGSTSSTRMWAFGPGSITSNTAFGQNALKENTSGLQNTAFGVNALITNTTGQENTAVGWGALQLTTGTGNTAIGRASGQLNAGGTYNTYVGYSAGQNGTSGVGNVFVGYGAGQSVNSQYGVYIGYTAAPSSAAGSSCIAIGYNAGPGTGAHNISIGQSAGVGMTSGNYNMHLGYRSVGSGVTTGNYNTLIGSDIVVGNVSNNAVLADMQGNIAIRKDANHYVGIGYTGSAILGAKLDVKAQGALSTDIALRVRNSAESRTPFAVLGNEITQISDDGVGFAASSLPLNIKSATNSYSAWLGLDIEHTVRTGYFSLQSQGLQDNYNQVRFSSGGSKANAKISAYITQTNTDKQGHWHFRTQVHLGDALRTYNNNLGQHTLLIETGSAPTTGSANSFIMYATASSAGNASPHFRTENGSIIKLYKEIQPALSGSANTGDATTDALIEAMKTIILNLGLGASS